MKNWRQFTPFYFYTVVVACLIASASATEERSFASILTLLTAGFLSWAFVEYGLHRFAFHYEARSDRARRLVYEIHLSHHENPRSVEQLFAGLGMSIPLAACYWLLAWALVGDWRATAYLFAGLIAGYFCYELMHYQAHHLSPRLRLFRYLKKYHLLHHHRTPNLRFGVTTPLVDLLFGTFRPVRGTPPRRAEGAPLS